MSQTAVLPTDAPPATAEGWTLHVAGELDSTNSACQHLPAWHAMRARVQTRGRGRTGRFWVSDEGGLWLSAVVPCPGPRSKWSILPLAIGWAVIEALAELGVQGLRLRWPNDVMIGRRKLAGLLLERFNDDTAVAGIGLNVFNTPESADAALEGMTARLQDLTPVVLTLDEISGVVLRAVARAQTLIRDDQFDEIAGALNAHWSEPRRVAVTLAGRPEALTGTFQGIDVAGRLQLATAAKRIENYDPAQVILLREID